MIRLRCVISILVACGKTTWGRCYDPSALYKLSPPSPPPPSLHLPRLFCKPRWSEILIFGCQQAFHWQNVLGWLDVTYGVRKPGRVVTPLAFSCFRCWDTSAWYFSGNECDIDICPLGWSDKNFFFIWQKATFIKGPICLESPNFKSKILILKNDRF